MESVNFFFEQKNGVDHQFPHFLPVNQSVEIDKPGVLQLESKKQGQKNVKTSVPDGIFTDTKVIGTAPDNAIAPVVSKPKEGYMYEKYYASSECLPLLRPFLTDDLLGLLLSEKLDEFKRGIIQVQEQIGQHKFILALTLYNLHSEWRRYKKTYKRIYGVNSLMEIVASLPEKYRLSRQSFNNAIKAGKALVHLLNRLPSEYNNISLDREVTINSLFKGYSKLPFLAKLIDKRTNDFLISTEDILFHLEHDSARAFCTFVDSIIQDKKKTEAPAKKQRSEELALPELTEIQKAIIRETAKGRYTYFFIDRYDDPALVKFVKGSLYSYYPKREEELRSSKVSLLDLDYLAQRGILPTNITCFIRFVLIETCEIKMKQLQEVLVTGQMSLTQLRIAQAFVTFKIHWDSKIQDAFRQTEGNISPREIVKKYLEIDNSTTKMLLRIGDSLKYLPRLYEAGIDPLAEGSLDKLANFDHAYKMNGLPATINAFRCCTTVQQFRKFAKTGRLPDPFADSKLLSRVYKRAKPILDEYDEKCNYGLKVYPLSLYSRADEGLVEKFTKQYFEKREQAIRCLMCPTVLLLPDKMDSQPPY